MKFFLTTILILIGISTTANAQSMASCLKSPNADSTSIEDCRDQEFANNAVTIKKVSTNAKAYDEKTISLDMGLGDPIFTGLKRTRDKFINKYIDQNISKIETIKEENMRKYNLQNIFGGIPTSSDLAVRALKAVFGFSDVSEVLETIKQARLKSCRDSRTSKMTSCDTEADPIEKSKCREEANTLVNDCFILSAGTGSMSKIQDMFKDWEDQINAEIDALTIVNQPSVKSVIDKIKLNANKFDGSIKKLNDIINVTPSGKFSDFLNKDPYTLVESFWASKMGGYAVSLGSNSYKNAPQEPLLSFKSGASMNNKVNDLCELTKCLAWPDNKMESNSEYKASCIDQGYTKQALNGQINKARISLMQKMAAILLKEIMIMLPVQEYMKMIKQNLICSIAATTATLKSETTATATDSTNFLSSLSNMASSATDFVSASGGTMEKLASCISETNQTKDGTKAEASGALQKSSGVLQSYLYGLITFTVNIPYGTLGMKATQEQSPLSESKAELNVEQCMKQGRTEQWVKAFDECKINSDFFNLDININPEIPRLMVAIRDINKFNCQQSKIIDPAPTKTLGTLESNTRMLVAADIADAIAGFKSEVYLAQKQLTQENINYKNFLPTKVGICGMKVLSSLIQNQKNLNIFSCQLWDDHIHLGSIPIEWSINSRDLTPDSLRHVSDSCKVAAEFTYDYLTTQSSIDIKDPKFDGQQAPLETTSDYAISRAISIVRTCDIIIENFLQTPPNNDQVNPENIENEILFDRKLDLGYGVNPSLQAIEYGTILSLQKRNFNEQFNICITNPIPTPNKDIDSQKLVYDATTRFCRDFRVILFDRYYSDATTAFNYPVISDKDAEKVDLYIQRQKKYYREGTYD